MWSWATGGPAIGLFPSWSYSEQCTSLPGSTPSMARTQRLPVSRLRHWRKARALRWLWWWSQILSSIQSGRGSHCRWSLRRGISPRTHGWWTCCWAIAVRSTSLRRRIKAGSKPVDKHLCSWLLIASVVEYMLSLDDAYISKYESLSHRELLQFFS